MTTHSHPIPALFIWIPKAAGTSIWTALQSTGHVCQDLHNDTRWIRQDVTFATFGHSGLPSLVDSGVITNGYLARRFKFAFVRNPWDRMVSLFLYLARLSHTPTFRQFVEGVAADGVPAVGAYNVRGLSQANPQLDWLRRPNGRFITDFIGRYERLREDWRFVCRQIGIQAAVPHLNRSRRRRYRHYYDTVSRNHVARRYAEEIDLFKYAF